MTPTRRDFLKAAGLAAGATLTLPGWAYELEAAEALAVDKDRLADVALSTAKRLGASYADIRIARTRVEAVSTRERQVQNVARNQNSGFGVRVLVRGTWGFAASPLATVAEVRRVTNEAVEIARANSLFQRKPIRLAPAPKASATWKS
ncbi:MAG TPA: DNA gyrase modulator, partial [Pyrinomonadaceae bacterium]|nr:DNA gyrase modulator [Pyrinomonadaceae bacterium]